MLSKSDFIRYIQCSRYDWIYKNRPDLKDQIEFSVTTERIIEEGNEVEAYARAMHPNGVLAEGKYDIASENTTKLIDQGHEEIFQATVIVGDLIAMADILIYEPDGDYWIIAEVKGTSNVEKKHLYDAAFQTYVFEKAGFTIGEVQLIHVNTTFVKQGKITPNDLLVVEDITKDVQDMQNEVALLIQDALNNHAKKHEPKPRIIKQCNKGKPDACPFIKHCWETIPNYSIYDLNRVTEKKLNLLLDQNIQNICDVPDDFNMIPIQSAQVNVAKSAIPYIDQEGIHQELASLSYPLYFIDYESVNPAIPLFNGYKPFQQTVFQYSLHVIPKEGADALHFEYLQTQQGDPLPDLLASMRSNIGDNGSVIVWHASFEKTRNKEMAKMYPEYTSFLESINERTYDLKDIFGKKQLYIHPAFKGSASIKKVLPVLAPDLSHSDLNISEGQTASTMWLHMMTRDYDETRRTEIANNLLEYCKLDTWAMVRVWEELVEIL